MTMPTSIRRWTLADDDQLHELVDRGWSYIRIARKLDRSPGAISMRCKLHGISQRRHPELRTARRVAQTFGITHHAVTNWIRRGWLPARNGGRKGAPIWRISELDILAFIENDATWIAWEPGQITDADLQAYARELRTGAPRWVKVREVAAYHHVSHAAVWAWITLGLLPAVRYTGSYVRVEHMRAFVPPYQRQRAT